MEANTATSKKVNPRPMKKTPPVSTAWYTSPTAEVIPKVTSTPPGINAHQRSRPLKYTAKKPKPRNPRKNRPDQSPRKRGGRLSAPMPIKAKPGIAAHHSARKLVAKRYRK